MVSLCFCRNIQSSSIQFTCFQRWLVVGLDRRASERAGGIEKERKREKEGRKEVNEKVSVGVVVSLVVAAVDVVVVEVVMVVMFVSMKPLFSLAEGNNNCGGGNNKNKMIPAFSLVSGIL